jgi:FkbM family methyltransferase
MFSQNQEEKYILEYFKNKAGRFLDVGAYDGKALSNTYALVQRGWTGVMVEGSPSVYELLCENVPSNDITKLNMIVSTDNDADVVFYDNLQATATMNLENVRKWEKETPFTTIQRRTTHYEKMLETTGTEFDFVSIDVEGGSVELFFGLFPILTTVQCWCIEHDGNDQAIRKLCSGWKVLYFNAENIIIGR